MFKKQSVTDNYKSMQKELFNSLYYPKDKNNRGMLVITTPAHMKWFTDSLVQHLYELKDNKKRQSELLKIIGDLKHAQGNHKLQAFMYLLSNYPPDSKYKLKSDEQWVPAESLASNFPNFYNADPEKIKERLILLTELLVETKDHKFVPALPLTKKEKQIMELKKQEYAKYPMVKWYD